MEGEERNNRKEEEGRSVIFVIPARGGSIGIPSKNVCKVGGLPLVGRAARLASLTIKHGNNPLKSRYSSCRIVCSTDSEEIANEAREWGAEIPFIRPSSIATASTPAIDVILHALEEIKANDNDLIVLLQPTSPFTGIDDVLRGIDAIERLFTVVESDNRGAHRDNFSVVSITESKPLEWCFTLENTSNTIDNSDNFEFLSPSIRNECEDMIKGVTRRQDKRETHWRLNGSFYIAHASFLKRHRGWIVPHLRDKQQQGTIGIKMAVERSIDIDEPFDLLSANSLAFSSALLHPTLYSTPNAETNVKLSSVINSSFHASDNPTTTMTTPTHHPLSFRLGPYTVGDGEECLVIAEAGVNHNGSLKYAFDLVDVAAAAHCHVVKFQTFTAEKLCSLSAPKAEYQKLQSSDKNESQFEMLKKLQLTESDFVELAEYCKKKEIVFLSSPFDVDSVFLLQRIGVEGYKIGSGEITNWPLLRAVASTRLPIILSTGMSSLSEVGGAIDVIQQEWKGENRGLALLHCVSSYPTPLTSDLNLRAMATMKAAFGLPVGFSDHTMGLTASIAAVALGACIVEKHFTLDRNMEGPDHKASLEPHQLKELRNSISDVSNILGDGVKCCREIELEVRGMARKSLAARTEIKNGTIIENQHLISLRPHPTPSSFVSPSSIDQIIGKRASRDISEGTLLTTDSVV